MSDVDLIHAIDLLRRTGDFPEHRATLEGERIRRRKLRKGKEAA